MKKLTKLLSVTVLAAVLILSSCITAFARTIAEIPENCYKPTLEIAYDNEGGITGKTEYTYTQNGLLESETGYWYFTETSSYAVSYKNTYEYDENGNQTKQTYLYYDYFNPEELESGQVYYYTYNEHNDMTSEFSDYFTGSEWKFSYGIVYENEYDTSGKLIRVLNKGMISKTEAGDPSFKTEYFYDDNGKLSYTITYSYSDNTFKKFSKDVFEYDKNGNTVKYVNYWYRGEEIDEDNCEETFTVFDENNRVIEKEVYYEKTKVHKYVYKYDDKGRTLEAYDYGVARVNSEYIWQEYSKSIITYNDAKSTKTILDYSYINDDWELALRHEINYKVIHTKGIKHDGKTPTATEDGYKDYYSCALCGEYFEDENCTVKIEDLEKWKSAGGRGFLSRLSPPTGNRGTVELLLAIMTASVMLSGLCIKKSKSRING